MRPILFDGNAISDLTLFDGNSMLIQTSHKIQSDKMHKLVKLVFLSNDTTFEASWTPRVSFSTWHRGRTLVQVVETRKKQECFLCAVPVKSRPNCSVVEKTDDTREW